MSQGSAGCVSGNVARSCNVEENDLNKGVALEGVLEKSLIQH